MIFTLASILGLWLLFIVLRSMIRIALMNSTRRDVLSEVTDQAIRAGAAFRLRGRRDVRSVHPVLLCILPAFILSLITLYFVGAMFAFALLYWGTRAVTTWHQAFLASGSALNTLGFATPTSGAGQWLAVPEGALGLGIIVFLFTFIPSYQWAIRCREDRTSWLYVRVGNRPTGPAFLAWCRRSGNVGSMREVWEAWEDWFRMLGDTHSILPILTLAASVQEGQSWILASAAILDAAALTVVSGPEEAVEAANICLRTGTRALLAIAESLGQALPAFESEGIDPDRTLDTSSQTQQSLANLHTGASAISDSQLLEFEKLRRSYEPAVKFVAGRTFVEFERGSYGAPHRPR